MKVVQCWDDGVLDDIRVAEICRKYGAKASFNLNFGLHQAGRQLSWRYRDTKDVWRLGRDEFRSVYEGFTIANHTLTHPHLEKLPLDEARRNIREGREALEQHFGCAVTGFAYPFGTYNDEVRAAVRETGHVYARTVKNVDQVFPPEDPMAFHSNCHFLAPDFWARFERVQAAGAPVFYFWGHSYEILTEADWQKFEAQIARLSATPGIAWADLPALFAPGQRP